MEPTKRVSDADSEALSTVLNTQANAPPETQCKIHIVSSNSNIRLAPPPQGPRKLTQQVKKVSRSCYFVPFPKISLEEALSNGPKQTWPMREKTKGRMAGYYADNEWRGSRGDLANPGLVPKKPLPRALTPPPLPEDQFSIAEWDMIHDSKEVEKFENKLVKELEKELKKTSYPGLSVGQIRQYIQRYCWRKIKREVNSHAFNPRKKSILELISKEANIVETISSSLLEGFQLFSPQKPLLEYLYEFFSKYIADKKAYTPASLRLCLSLEEILGILKAKNQKTHGGVKAFLARLNSCCQNEIFKKNIYAAFGGVENITACQKEVQGLSTPLTYPFLREMVHTILWKCILCFETCHNTFAWKADPVEKEKLGQIPLENVIRCFVPDKKSGVLFEEIKIQGEVLNLQKETLPDRSPQQVFFERLIQKLYDKGFPREEGGATIRDEVDKLLKHNEIPCAGILRLGTINAWARAEMFARQCFPGIFNLEQRARRQKYRLYITVESPSKYVVTQTKEFTFYKFEDPTEEFPLGIERDLFKTTVSWEVTVEKKDGVGYFDGKFSLSMPRFLKPTVEEKEAVMDALDYPCL